MNNESLKNKIETEIFRSRQNVFMCQDFSIYGRYTKVGRVLSILVKKGILVRVGYGLYAKTRISSISGKQMLTTSLYDLGKEVMGRLGIKVVPSKMEEEYNSGRSTQIPTGRVIGIEGRVRRKVGYRGISLSFENRGKFRRKD